MIVPASIDSFLPRGGAAAPAFWGRVRKLERRYGDLWHSTDDRPPILGAPISPRRQRANHRAARRLIDELATEIEAYPEDEIGQREFRARLRARLHRFGERHLDWPRGYRSLLFGDAFYSTAIDFARAARAFDASLPPNDLSQAMRNVWIMNSLQMLLGLHVTLTPAVFAYSMLYPLTDNYLDDVQVSLEAKRVLNRRLERRLRGDAVDALDIRQRQIFEMIERIEEQYSREEFSEVHLSLEAIHRGQVASLSQAGSTEQLGDEELLRLSVAKGGASVLADGYLVAGALDSDEADFCFGYGVFLQLLDDLQDCVTDRDDGHATLFSVAAGESPERMARLTGRLCRFTRGVVEEAACFAAPEFDDRKDLILRNCDSLLVGAVAEHQGLFPSSFTRLIETRWPLRLAAQRTLRRRARKRYQKTVERLCRQRGIESLFDLLAEDGSASQGW